MKKLITLFLSLVALSAIHAQQIGSTFFTQLPQNKQLYPRNAKNEAQVGIKGSINTSGGAYYSVTVYRNADRYAYQKANITYQSANSGTFAFSPITIKAELAEYYFEIYLKKTTGDSVFVRGISDVVCGDVYVLTGQSNSTAFFNDSRTNEFCRTFGKITDELNTTPYNPADTLWALSNENSYSTGVGTMGFEFQKIIQEKYGIPTCLINGGFHWSSAQHHATRTATNPADLNNGYGRMLYRLQKAGVANNVKALIYRQGESEAYGEGGNFSLYFEQFYNNLKLDIPSIQKLYLFQIDIIDNGVAAAPMVREEQRRLGIKYANISVVPSVGTIGFDGLHYSAEGYQQNAREFSRLIGRDFYNSTDTDNIDAPNIQKAFFTNPERTQIALIFQDNQVLKWPEVYRDAQMKDFFYLNNNSGWIQNGFVQKNAVILNLTSSANFTDISYLPSLIPQGNPLWPYSGPYVTNKTGMRALSFYQYPIGAYNANNVIPQDNTPVVTFSKIPQNLQLFARNAQNQANITVKATLQQKPIQYNYVSLMTLRNGSPYKYQKTAITYASGASNFELSTTIKAELAEYSIQLYAVGGKDSVLLAERKQLVAGDFFVIQGQGNAKAWRTINSTAPTYAYTNEYCRSFGGMADATKHQLADTTWLISNTAAPYVGVWGIEIQRLIAEKYGIPSCIINVAEVNGSIKTQNISSGSSDISSIYGRLLYKVNKAGASNAIKALFWWGGEIEATNDPNIYQSEFDKLYKLWQKDFPSITRIYCYQNDIYKTPNYDAGALRNFQRTLANTYPLIQAITPLGATDFYGYYYATTGYLEIASETFRWVENDFYTTNKVSIVGNPNLKRAFFTSAKKDEIALVFDDNQTLKWPNEVSYDGVSLTLKDFFYLGQSSEQFLSGRAEGNRVYLKRANTGQANTITYLPPYFAYNNFPKDPRTIFNGPFLSNITGQKAFSFHEVAIMNSLDTPTVTILGNSASTIDISWTSVTGANSYLLQVLKKNDLSLIVTTTFNTSTLKTQIKNLSNNTEYLIQIKAIGEQAESESVQVTAETFSPLVTPQLTATVNYYNSISLNWSNNDTNASTFVLERKTASDTKYTQIARLSVPTITYKDLGLSANTTYSYRLKSQNSKTESAYASIEIKTPALLNTPTLAATAVSHEAIKLTWNNIANATYYTIERMAENETNYTSIAQVNSPELEYLNTPLKDQTTYQYRIRAYSSISESQTSLASAKTFTILATEQEINDLVSISPNPTSDFIKIQFKKPFTGDLHLYELTGKTIHQTSLEKVTEHSIACRGFQSGLYILIFRNNTGNFSEKIQIIQK